MLNINHLLRNRRVVMHTLKTVNLKGMHLLMEEVEHQESLKREALKILEIKFEYFNL